MEFSVLPFLKGTQPTVCMQACMHVHMCMFMSVMGRGEELERIKKTCYKKLHCINIIHTHIFRLEGSREDCSDTFPLGVRVF